MDSGITVQIIILVFLLMGSAFFSASETALMSLSKIRLRQMVEEEVPRAELIQRLLENPSRLLGAILIGNNIVNIGASSLATSVSMSLFGSAGIGVATGVMTFLVLIFGEITPKTLAAERAEQVSLKIAKVVAFLTVLFKPILVVVLKLTSFLVKLAGGEGNTERPFVTEEEIKIMVNVGHEEGVLEGGEKKMIYNVFDFGDSQVRDVMTQRTDMAALDRDSSYEEILAKFKEEQFSRLPVYEDNIDNIIGILYLKDLFFYEGTHDTFVMDPYLRKPYFTFEFKKTAELFRELQAERVPIAIVLDEYGGTAGMVTMEDLVEEIVGDIRDEYDVHEDNIEVVKENEYIVEGSTRIDEVNEMLGTQIESGEFESIGGFVLGQLGRMPEIGENLEYQGIRFIVEHVEKNRIDKLRIKT
ncbi:MAG: magnesium and cobalt exporter, family [Clostridiales bacterium]|nr:magnesium and cobalt exporter, family [Clostridiales bacterium]